MSVPRWISHGVLLRRLVADVVLVAVDPIRVGSGLREDNVLRIQYIGERPVIPGSSIKGVLRSVAERVAASAGVRVCRPVPVDQSCMRTRTVNGLTLEEFVRERLRIDRAGVLAAIWRELCIACKIFGAASYASHVLVSDGEVTDASTVVRPHVAISRQFGTVQNFFQVEALGPGTRIRFRLVGNNLPNYATWLLLRALIELDDGRAKLGGFKSRGYGRVRVEWNSTRLVFEGYGKALDECDEDVDVSGSYTGQGARTVVDRFEPAWRRFVSTCPWSR